MDVSVEFKWNPRVQNGLKKIPDDILYEIARDTLVFASPTIPQDTRTMYRQTNANGVRGGNGDFYLQSSPGYAKYVWNMENVNWTTPGTNNKWFARALKKHGATIINNAINKSWRKDMQ